MPNVAEEKYWNECKTMAKNTWPQHNDLLGAQHPSDDEKFDVGVRCIHLSHYVDWFGDRNAALMTDLYGWKG